MRRLSAWVARLFGAGEAAASGDRTESTDKRHDDGLQVLATIAEASSDAIFAKDLTGRYLFANRGTGEALDRRADEIVGATDRQLFPGQADELAAIDRRVLFENQVLAFEEHLDTPHGPRVYEAIKGPLRDPAGNLVGVFGISRDVTQLRESQLAFDRQRERIERHVQELERFNAAMVDRELRMVELKREVNGLLVELGRAPRYDVDDRS